MFFCSDSQMETCSSSREDNAIFPRIHDNDKFLLDSIIMPIRKEEAPAKHQTTTLPQAGTPLSIFEFAGLSSEQQKQWLEASGSCDVKQNTTPQRSAKSKVLVLPSCRNVASCEQSLKTDETDTDESVTSLSSRSGGDQESSQSCTSGVQKRSIFAPYWAKTSGKVLQDGQDHVQHEDQDSAMVQILKQASQKSMVPPPLSHHSDFGPRTSCGQDKHIIALPRLQQSDTTSIATLPKHPSPLLTPQRRAVSTSAISILKKKGDGQKVQEQPRRRSSSFSVSFDSRVNVVLVFQDKPPYQTTRRMPPWWARFLSGTGGTGEGDAFKAVEQLSVFH